MSILTHGGNRLRAIKCLSQGHSACKWWSQDLTLIYLFPNFMLFLLWPHSKRVVPGEQPGARLNCRISTPLRTNDTESAF